MTNCCGVPIPECSSVVHLCLPRKLLDCLMLEIYRSVYKVRSQIWSHRSLSGERRQSGNVEGAEASGGHEESESDRGEKAMDKEEDEVFREGMDTKPYSNPSLSG